MQNNQIKFLVASDLHLESNNVRLLVEKEKNNKYDFIVLLGDFLNLQHQAGEDNQIDELRNLIQPFKELNTPIYYIPGNHDCDELLEQKQKIDGCINIHKQQIKINDLTLIGFGGSLPGYNSKGQIWQGYPYKNEEQFSQDVAQLQIPQEGQVILLTHVGPSISQTTVSFELGQEDPITSGSDSLTKLINEHKNIILNVHGHTHDGVGIRRLGHCKVVNAGPLLYGNYCIITITNKVDKIEHIFI